MGENGAIMETQISREKIFGATIDGSSCDRLDLVSAVNSNLLQRGAAYVESFPLDAEDFVNFIRNFGMPLPNYASGEDLAAYRVHPNINRVRYEPRKAASPRFHEVGGAFPPHSARSWSKVRPRYFALLMCNPGWIDRKHGENGESIMVRWSDVLCSMRSEDPAQFEIDFDILSRTPLTFHAIHVREEVSDLPLLYQLADARGRLDVGVRLRQDLLEKLPEYKSQILDYSTYEAAVLRFWQHANKPDLRSCYRMNSGDIAIVDNNRFGHGRLQMQTAREHQGAIELNPRELWSIAMA
jgi:hypothetical protein